MIEIFVVSIIKRTNGVWVAIPLKPSPDYYKPYRENGIDIFRREIWKDELRFCWDWKPSDEERGKILRAIRKNHFSDAVYIRSEGMEEGE